MGRPRSLLVRLALPPSTRASPLVLRWSLGFSPTTPCRWVLRPLLPRLSVVLPCLSRPLRLLHLLVGCPLRWCLPSLRIRRLPPRSPLVLSRLLFLVLLQWLRPLRLPSCCLPLAFLLPVTCPFGLRTPPSPPSSANPPTSTAATRSSALHLRRPRLLWLLWCLRPRAPLFLCRRTPVTSRRPCAPGLPGSSTACSGAFFFFWWFFRH